MRCPGGILGKFTGAVFVPIIPVSSGVIPAIATSKNPVGRIGKDVMAVGGGVKVVPEQICIRVDGHALRTHGYVLQGEGRWRSDNLVEERKNIELRQIQTPLAIEK